jgi:hypothetical protein
MCGTNKDFPQCQRECSSKSSTCSAHRKLKRVIRRIERRKIKVNVNRKQELDDLIIKIKQHFDQNNGQLMEYTLPKKTPKQRLSTETTELFVEIDQYSIFLPFLDPNIDIAFQIPKFNLLFSVQERAEFIINSQYAKVALLDAETALINANSDFYQETQKIKAEIELKEVECAAISHQEAQRIDADIKLKEMEFAFIGNLR